MGISIKNDEVEEMIRLMAEKSGKPITEAVRIAVSEWLAAHGHRERTDEEERQRKLDEILHRIRLWPVYDDRDHAELLYDKDGVCK